MRLKSLKVFGFKTFAEATTLEFTPGTTAVVGPNGSGKSNLVDAIRWVLGEQSTRSLRSQRMEDVIFAGNNARKPLGMAEVSLTFDNHDHQLPLGFNEVQITRRAYRAGESEFYINREQVRLRDVHELLMGTGLGPGSYAIVSQGQIDAILSSKPTERRAQRTPFGRLRAEDRVDLSLRDDRVRAGAEPGSHQQLVHVAQPHLLAVDVELRLARAVGAPRDLHFVEAERQLVVVVVERQRDFGHPERLARVVAGEDDVFHSLRAQAARRLLAEHPADRVDQIRFAGAVGTDDGGRAVDEVERRRFGERFEAEDFEGLEAHG